MSTPRSCPTCGAALPDAALLGNCPACLLRLAATPVPQAASAEIPPPSLPEALRYFGDYELQREIARGGMGRVFQARQVSLNRPVALKTIAAGELASPALVQRFRLEAEAAARLHHPNIVALYEVGEHQGQHFYSMELIEGGSLSQGSFHERRGRPAKRFDNRHAATIISKVARAVHYAHHCGVLHRDLKPSNILLDAVGEPRVTDFGLAKLGDSRLTQSEATLGTPAYMAPELASGHAKQATIAADVYGLGAILYELLTGQPPFHASTALETMRRVVEEEPVRPRTWRSEIDADLETICLKCLRKEPAARYPSAEAVAEELQRWLAGEPIVARPVGPGERLIRWCRRKPALASALGAAALLLLTVLIGSPITALRIRAAQQEAVAKLRESYLAHAQANRFSGRPGRRYDSLEVIARAAAMNPSPELRESLRNEVIACLALTDLRPVKRWEMKGGRWEGRLCFDPQMELYALAADRTNISVWRVADDREVARLPSPGSAVNWIHGFGPDRRFLATFHRGETLVWDVTNQVIVLRVAGENAPAFSPEGGRVAVSRRDGWVALYTLAPSNEVRRLSLGKHLLNPRFHPDGTKLAGLSADRQSVEVVDLADGQGLHSLALPARGRDLAFSSDGRWLAAGTLQGHIVVWDTAKGERQWASHAHETQVNKVAFNQAGDLLASVSWEGSLRLWDAPTGRLITSYPGSSYDLQFSPDDRRLAHVQAVSHAALLEVAAHPEFRLLLPAEPGVYRWSVAFSSDGRLIATGGEEIRFWDWREGRELAALRLYDFRSIHFLRHERGLITSGFEGLLRWQLEPENAGGTNFVRFGARRRLIAETNLVHSAVSEDERFVVVADRPRDRALVIDLEDPSRVIPLGPHRGVHYVAISPDHRFVATGSYQGVGAKVWEVASQRELGELSTQNHVRVAFSPNGRWLATTGEDVRIYECGTWRPHQRLRLAREGTTPDDAVFSPDSALLAVGHSPRNIHFYLPETGQRLAVLEAPQPATLARLAFSPDGATLAALQYNQAVQLWDLRRIRQQLARMNLDWDLPAYPAEAATPATNVIRVAIARDEPATQ
jgi:WD40 repeat protein